MIPYLPTLSKPPNLPVAAGPVELETPSTAVGDYRATAEQFDGKGDGTTFKPWNDASGSDNQLYRLSDSYALPLWHAAIINGAPGIDVRDSRQDVRENHVLWQNGENNTFLVLQTVNTSSRLVIQETESGYLDWRIDANGLFEVVRDSGSVVAQTPAAVNDGTPRLYRVHCDLDGLWSLYVDGALEGQVAGGTAHYAGGFFPSFRVAEGNAGNDPDYFGMLIVCTGAVTEPEVQDIQTYAEATWGIEI